MVLIITAHNNISICCIFVKLPSSHQEYLDNITFFSLSNTLSSYEPLLLLRISCDQKSQLRCHSQTCPIFSDLSVGNVWSLGTSLVNSCLAHIEVTSQKIHFQRNDRIMFHIIIRISNVLLTCYFYFLFILKKLFDTVLYSMCQNIFNVFSW